VRGGQPIFVSIAERRRPLGPLAGAAAAAAGLVALAFGQPIAAAFLLAAGALGVGARLVPHRRRSRGAPRPARALEPQRSPRRPAGPADPGQPAPGRSAGSGLPAQVARQRRR